MEGGPCLVCGGGLGITKEQNLNYKDRPDDIFIAENDDNHTSLYSLQHL